jgi:hypothetical protein
MTCSKSHEFSTCTWKRCAYFYYCWWRILWTTVGQLLTYFPAFFLFTDFINCLERSVDIFKHNFRFSFAFYLLFHTFGKVRQVYTQYCHVFLKLFSLSVYNVLFIAVWNLPIFTFDFQYYNCVTQSQYYTQYSFMTVTFCRLIQFGAHEI